MMTTNLLLLSGPQPHFHPQYRGTARQPPFHWTNLPDDNELNALFFWYLSVSDQATVVHDPNLISKLQKMRDVYNRYSTLNKFEIVEAVPQQKHPLLGERLLGIDLSLHAVGYSLLDGWDTPEFEARLSRNKDAAGHLARLIYRHFKPTLNEHRLFADIAIANDALQSMNSLQSLVPQTYENGHFEAVALYEVTA